MNIIMLFFMQLTSMQFAQKKAILWTAFYRVL